MELTHRPVLTLIDRRPRRFARTPTDTTLACERLGWVPSVSGADGLQRTIEWFSRDLDARPADGFIRS